jgi:hypothetical protein
VQGARLVFYHDVIIQEAWFISASIAEVLLQLADGGPAGDLPLRGQRLPRVYKMCRANPETHIPPPPQLGKIAKSIKRALSITP